ncbi:MAG TPA: hypothetical protein VMU66_04115, partial [Gaiellales bacterium]|nr:hypothetical protein [Gaiellales bacterium]
MEASDVREPELPAAIAAAAETARRTIENCAAVVQAPIETLERCVLAILCEGHVILEDYPGVGKTMLAKS